MLLWLKCIYACVKKMCFPNVYIYPQTPINKHIYTEQTQYPQTKTKKTQMYQERIPKRRLKKASRELRARNGNYFAQRKLCERWSKLIYIYTVFGLSEYRATAPDNSVIIPLVSVCVMHQMKHINLHLASWLDLCAARHINCVAVVAS